MRTSLTTIGFGALLLLPADPAAADCAFVDPLRVLCDATDPDGFASGLPGLEVTAIGTVLGADALQLLGPAPTVQNVGSLIGASTGIRALTSLTVVNSSTIQGSAGAAISAGTDAEITNTGNGFILGTSVGIDAVSNLLLTNTALVQGSFGPAVRAQLDGTILNSVGGQIIGGSEGAVEASFGLRLNNAGGSITAAAGGDATVNAGVQAQITNSLGGEIGNLIGPAIEATSGLTLENLVSGKIESTSGEAVKAGDVAEITNSGRIDGLLGGVELGLDSSLTNAVGGSVTSLAGSAIAGTGRVELENRRLAEIVARGTRPTIDLRNAAGSVIDNDGDITAFSDDAIDVSAAGPVEVFNRLDGVIESRAGNGIVADTVTTELENAGKIDAAAIAVEQQTGRLRLRNLAPGRIVSQIGAAVVAEEADIRNAARATISGFKSGLTLESGTVENDGLIEARDGDAIVVGNGGRTVTLTNRGEIGGDTGIRFDTRHDAGRIVSNSGRIHASRGPAIDFAADAGTSELRLQGDSALFGDVLFGGSDDELRLFDLTSGVLIDGLFDGGAGTDTLIFDATFGRADFLAVDFTDTTTVDITVLAENGDALFGTFRNFDLFQIQGQTRSFAGLQAEFAAPVPLPGTLALALLGFAGLWGLRRQG